MPRTLNTPLGQMIDRRGLRRDYVATRLGLKSYTLSRIMSGSKQPSDAFWREAAILLGCDESDIRPAPEPEQAAA